jgi:hypothetical protein
MFQETRTSDVIDTANWPGLRKKVDLTALAREALESVQGDREKAAPVFLRNLRNENLGEYEYRVSVAMRAWAHEIISMTDRKKRDAISEGAPTPRDDSPEAKKARMTQPNQPLTASSLKSVAYAWFDWPVLPGVMLRNATRADLNAAAQNYFKNSNTMTRRANWLSAIAEKLTDDTTKVADALKESDVAMLAEKHRVSTN